MSEADNDRPSSSPLLESSEPTLEQPPELTPARGLGAELLVKKAAVDEEFRARFLTHRGEVARALGVELSPAEREMLASVTADQLATMVRVASVSSSERKIFASDDGAAMLAWLAEEQDRRMLMMESQVCTGSRPHTIPQVGPGPKALLYLLLLAAAAFAIYWFAR